MRGKKSGESVKIGKRRETKERREEGGDGT